MNRRLFAVAAVVMLGISGCAQDPSSVTAPSAISQGLVSGSSTGSKTITVASEAGAAEFEYLVATGFLCGLAPEACPAISKAANGDSIELSGAGTLSIHPKSVTGGGAFTHKAADGSVIGAGTWEATQLLSFDSYGTSPGFSPDFEGGFALMRVHLSPGFDAILRIDCALGKVPAGHTPDGIDLAVEGGPNFNKRIGGFTIFIRQ